MSELTMSIRHSFLLLLASTFLTSCEQIDLANIDGTTDKGEHTADIPMPLRTGEGTADAPFTVTDLLDTPMSHNDENVWVIGYAVGTARQSMKNAVFTSPFLNESNLLIAAKPDCTEAYLCLPIQLKTDKLKDALSLNKNEDMHHQCLMIRGTIGQYLSTTGMRSIDQYIWFPGLSIPDSTPEDWTTDSLNYN